MFQAIFKTLAYLYVALALAPLVVLAVVMLVGIAGGQTMWPFGPWSMDPGEMKPLKDEVTFRTGLVPVTTDERGAPETFAIGVGKASYDPESSSAARLRAGTYYVAAPEVEYVGIGASQMGAFNNILLMRKGSEPRKLFERAMSVKFFAAVEAPRGKVLLILATDKDTNDDGSLGPEDLHGVFIHTLAADRPRPVSSIPGSVTAVDTVSEPGAVIVRTTLDRNGDGSASRIVPTGYLRWSEEPQLAYRIDLTTLEASPLVPPSTVEDLQKALEAPVSSK